MEQLQFFRIMRKGKTKRDRQTGAHAKRLKNLARRSEENRKGHGK
jgi:hypothetical protein